MTARPYRSFPLNASQWVAQARAMAANLPEPVQAPPAPLVEPLTPEEEEMMLW